MCIGWRWMIVCVERRMDGFILWKIGNGQAIIR
jgi:hypothetical protein